ncbi:uncharacterized protein LOC144297159 isoform X3 [Canis aureus]
MTPMTPASVGSDDLARGLVCPAAERRVRQRAGARSAHAGHVTLAGPTPAADAGRSSGLRGARGARSEPPAAVCRSPGGACSYQLQRRTLWCCLQVKGREKIFSSEKLR